MPTYEYRCNTCGKEFAILAKMSDAPPTRGQDCVSSKCTLEKLLSKTAIVAKSSTSGAFLQPMGSTKAEPESEKAAPCASGCAHLTH